jgi:regulator of RNase E activity RraA
MVSDGPVRASETIAALALPVFCAGASAPSNLIRPHAVDINVPIGCGGVAVFPGDVIVGVGDGGVVMPAKWRPRWRSPPPNRNSWKRS